MKNFVLGVVFFLVLFGVVYVELLMWCVSDVDSEIYLFGFVYVFKLIMQWCMEVLNLVIESVDEIYFEFFMIVEV